MNHAKEFIEVMRKLEPILRDHPPLSVIKFSHLCDYVAWYWNRGTISYVLSDFDLESASGVCLIKLFRRLDQFLEPFIHDPCGTFCMVEFLGAKEPNAIAGCFEQLFTSWGPQKVMLWDRGERTEGGAPKMYTWRQYMRLTRRLTYGIVYAD